MIKRWHSTQFISNVAPGTRRTNSPRSNRPQHHYTNTIHLPWLPPTHNGDLDSVQTYSHPHRGTATQRPVPSAPIVAMRTLGKRCVNNTKEYSIVGNALTCNLAAHPRRNLLRCRAGQSTHWRHRSPLGLGHLRCHDSWRSLLVLRRLATLVYSHNTLTGESCV